MGLVEGLDRWSTRRLGQRGDGCEVSRPSTGVYAADGKAWTGATGRGCIRDLGASHSGIFILHRPLKRYVKICHGWSLSRASNWVPSLRSSS
jgi:hypothetical protein